MIAKPYRAIIGYITPEIYSSYYRLLLAGVQRAARERDAQLMVFQMTPLEVVSRQLGYERVSGWVSCFSDRHTDGLADLAQAARPLVTLTIPVANAPLVVTDNAGGMRAMVLRLLELGHRRIAFVLTGLASYASLIAALAATHMKPERVSQF